MRALYLRRYMEAHGYEQAMVMLQEGLISGQLNFADVSLRDMALTFGGEEWYRRLGPPTSRQRIVELHEAGEAVDSTMFTNITGNVVFARIMAGYNQAAFVSSQLAETIPTRSTRGELIPGVSSIDGTGDIVHEGMDYPEYGLEEDYIQTPPTFKRGLIVSVTREAIYEDRTNLILRQASQVGSRLALNKEKRVIDVVIGAVNNFKRKGTTFNTYLTAGAWINKMTGNELFDYLDVDEALALFTDMVNPYDSEPIVLNPTMMIVQPPKLMTARRVIGATEISESTNTGNTTTVSANPVAGSFQILSSPFIYAREKVKNPTNAAKRWYLGNPAAAFGYAENWGIETLQAQSNAEAAFERDIVARYRASERGEAFVQEPRQMVAIEA